MAVLRWMLLVPLLLVAGGPVSARSRQPSTVTEAARATVFIKVDRRFRGSEITTTGSGFFIDSSGFVLTNRHVVGETIEGRYGGEDHEINVTVVGLTAVVEVGSSAERELPAKVIAEDRKRDLALLKVGYCPAFYLQPRQQAMPAVTDRVSVIGYPFGDLLSMNSNGGGEAGGNPEPSINLGRVTSIRRDQDDEVVAIQTDAAINPGNSGGPMLSADMRLIGVVYAGISGGDQVGFAISPNRVWDFISNQSVKVRFTPPYVFESRTPIQVSISSGMYPLQAQRGIVRLEGDDISPLEVDLQRVDSEWQARLVIPGFQPDQQTPDEYIATVRLYQSGRRVVLERRYTLERRGVDAAVLASHRSAAATMRDRGYLSNELSFSDHADRLASQREASEAAEVLIEAPEEVEQSFRVNEAQQAPVTAAAPDTVGSAQPETRSGPEQAADLAERGRTLMIAEDYQGAAELFAEALRLDPDNQVAAAFLEVATAKTGGGAGPATAATADTGEVVPVTLRFDAPMAAGRVEIVVDGSLRHTIDFDFGKVRLRGRRGGRVTELRDLPTGRHAVTIRLSEGRSHLLGERSFSEFFDQGSQWTIRINLRSLKESPGIFLVAHS